MPPYVVGAQYGALWRAAGCFYGVIQWSLGKENELGSHVLNLCSVVQHNGRARRHSCVPIKQLPGAGHCIFFHYIICVKGKRDLWALNTGRDALAAFTMMLVFGRKGERGCLALSMNYV